MLICEFFGWAEEATAGERAEAAGALARTYLYAELDPVDLGDAERALTALLDDPSPLVRRALAEALAPAADAPHHILAALAADRPDIAALVLEWSPVLCDGDLIDAAAMGDDVARCALARRRRVSAALAGALAEIGGAESALALSRNPGAVLGSFAARRLIERFGENGDIRDALARRSDLPPEMRHALVVATAAALSGFAERCGWLNPERARRVAIEARERATMTIGATLPDRGSAAGNLGFVAYLHDTGHLTPALLMRALLGGNLALFEAALAELSGKSLARIAGLTRSPDGLGFAALYKGTGLPPSLLPAVRAALRALQAVEAEPGDGRLRRWMIGRVLQDSARLDAGRDLGALTVLLRRLEAEAAREEARDSRLDRRMAAAIRDRMPPLPAAVPEVSLPRAA